MATISAAAVVFAVTLLILFQFDPAVSRIFPPCPFHTSTGLYCPGCGSLRAIHALLHGRPAQALAMNPLMVVSLPVVTVLYLRRSRREWVWLPWCALAVLVTYAVLRNIPAWPFMLLAPK